MHIKTLLVTFKSGSFIITETKLSKESVDNFYHKTQRDAVYVSIDRMEPFMSSDICPPITYSIYDMRTRKDIRRGHTIITTRTSVGRLKEVLEITNNASMSNLKYLLHRDPGSIAQLIKELEKRYVRYPAGDLSIFSDHPQSDTFFYGLAYTLIMQDVEDRPNGL